MDQKTQNAKSAIAMESILRDIERLAAAAGVSEQALENMRRPYGRGADRRVNQTHHAAHVLNLSVVSLLGPVAVEAEPAPVTETEPAPPVDDDSTTETETETEADPAVEQEPLPEADDATEPAPVPESARRRKGR